MEKLYLPERWRVIRCRVDEACRRAGRAPSSVSILPVSKYSTSGTIREAASLGFRRFAENRVQDIRDKSVALADLDISWVMIGHVQLNKVKEVARRVSEVQSLDCLALAAALDQRLRREDRCMDVLIQVKTSPEHNKHGLPSSGLGAFLEEMRRYDSLRVRGLMTLAVRSDDSDQVRACFRQLRQLRDAAQARGHAVTRLSMGMSGDFPLAIMEGATEIRIGQTLFSARAGL